MIRAVRRIKENAAEARKIEDLKKAANGRLPGLTLLTDPVDVPSSSQRRGKKRQECRRSCERTYMKSTSESLSHPETSYGRAAEGNCVVARRGGEQPDADLRSQTKVNPIRFTTAASLLGNGEACRMSGNRFPLHPSSTREKRVVVDGWGENAGKVSCGSVEWERSGHRVPGGEPREG